MSEVENSLSMRHMFDKSAQDNNLKTTEELLIENLDTFLSSIETSLDNFESFFRFKKDEEAESKEEVDDSTEESGKEEKTSRRSSSASLSSFKTISMANLNLVHQRLKVIKDSVLRTSFTNLEHLYKTLDDQYTYLFNYGNAKSPDGSFSEVNNKENLSQKIITTIQYFDEKLLQIDDFIKSSRPEANYDYDADSAFNHLKYYNFNKALKKAQDNYLHYYDLPLSWRENKYIIYGYRFSLKHTSMLRSIFHFNHNETMNIWTHMVGVILLLYISIFHFPNTDIFSKNSFRDNTMMYIFLVAALKCLVSSVIWHTYSCFAKLPVRSRCACVDYTGITVLITCSVISAEYCSLYQYPALLKFYISFSSICGFAGFVFNWSPYFDKPECRSLRIGFFMGLAFLGFTAIICKCFYEGFVNSVFFFLPLVYKSFIFYWLGVVFYGGLIPERWRYDISISEEASCSRTPSSSDVLHDNIEHSGREEFKNMEKEIEEIEDRCLKADQEETKFQNVLDKHFPPAPTKTPYSKDFLSLWWVDYVFSSHSIWHIFVVFGIVGHYFTLLSMFERTGWDSILRTVNP